MVKFLINLCFILVKLWLEIEPPHSPLNDEVKHHPLSFYRLFKWWSL